MTKALKPELFIKQNYLLNKNFKNPFRVINMQSVLPYVSLGTHTVFEGLGASSQKTNLLGGVAQILINPRPSHV